MKKHFVFVVLAALTFASFCRGQNFSPTPISFTPNNFIEFKINQPLSHIDINNYVPSKHSLYAGQQATFRFHLRHGQWSNYGVFMNLRWDSDLDSSNGIQWSNWEQNNNGGYYRDVTKTFSTPGKYVVTFEIKFINTAGAQSITRQKEQEIVVAPMPTAVYADQNNNKLFFFLGGDNVYNKPTFLVEGFDPDNGNTPEINYSLGFDLIEEARAQGYDIFIMEFANGGVDLTANRGVFLGACTFLHTLLGSTEAAIQVVGISMGGTIGRYGLAWAEDNGPDPHPGQYIEHYVNTFISFDSPQQGAHVNTGLQTFIKNRGNSTQQGVLQSVAAKQMLYENVYGTEHNSFYNTLKSLHNSDELGYGYTNGYPRRCLNFSVSNGNHNAVYPNRTTNDVLARLRIYVNINANDVITLPYTQIDSNIYAQPRDLWAGSTFTHDLTTLFAYGTKRVKRDYWGPIWVDAYATWRFQVNFNPSYTPTESSLDLEGYTRTANGTLVGGTSWFNGTLEQIAPRRHEELTVESKTQVMSWLNSNRTYAYLGRPTSVTAQFQAGIAVILNFQDKAAFEQGFKIERKIAGGSWAEIATLQPNTISFSDPISGLQNFQTYYYRVKSYSGSRSSPFSPEVAVAIQPHLASNSQQATATSSQRKLSRWSSDVISQRNGYSLFYESGNQIWNTTSTNLGATWMPEKLVSTNAGIHKSPSIALGRSSGFGGIYTNYDVVWHTITPTADQIWYARHDYWGGGLAPSLVSSFFTPHSLIPAAPVVAYRNTDHYKLLVGYTSANGIEIMKSSDYGGTWIRDTYSDSLRNRYRPSFASLSSSLVCLSYDNGSLVFFDYYYRHCIGDPCSYYEGWWRVLGRRLAEVVPGSISTRSGFVGSSQVVAIAPTLNRVGVVWATREGVEVPVTVDEPVVEQLEADVQEDTPILRDDYSVCFQSKYVTSNVWGPVNKFVGRNYRNPTISHLTNGRMLWTWTDGQSIIRSQSTDYGVSWSSPARLEQGVDPQVVIGAENSSQAISYVYRSGAGPVYQLAFPRTEPPVVDKDEVTREMIVADEGSDASLDIEMFPLSLKTSTGTKEVIPFAIADSAFAPSITNIEQYLETASYAFPQNADSIYIRIRMSSKDVSSIAERNTRLRVKLHCSVNGAGQRTLARWRFMSDHSLNKTFRVPARVFRGKRVKFYVSVLGLNRENPDLLASGASVHYSRFTPGLPKDGDQTERGIPSSYNLHANYPNPFNPSTTIKFDLPENSNISLVVYDVLGRKIAELENGMKEAGYHSATWDASSVASGVYFARFTAIDANGTLKLSKVNKLLLTK